MKLSTILHMSTSYYLSGKCIYLTSAPGRGKTSTIMAAVPKVAKELGLNLGITVLQGPLLNPADTVGYLVPTKGEEGRIESKYTEPFWWRTDEGKRLNDYDGGIVFIDEIDKADMDVKKMIGEMALSGRCGVHKLPKGWVVWMAGNRAGDRSGSTKELDHLINRRFEVGITDDLVGWEDWALSHGVHPSGIAFAMQNPQIVFPDSLPDRQGPFCTPRSLVATIEMLTTLAGNTGEGKLATLPTDTDAIEMAAGGIGQAAAAQLFAMLRLESELPTLEEIIKSPDTTRLPTKADAQMLVCYKLAHVAEAASLEPVIQYIERLPADFAVTFAKALVKRDPLFAAKPAMMAWVRRNSAIMQMVGLLRS